MLDIRLYSISMLLLNTIPWIAALRNRPERRLLHNSICSRAFSRISALYSHFIMEGPVL